MSEKEKQALRVNMFGTFSMSYGDRLITGKSRSSESQFNYLMQLILHMGKDGAGRHELEETLFRNKDLNNIHHAAQSVIYNAKKKLREFGLPDVNYIEQVEGKFYWTDEIPVIEDARLFESYYEQAEKEEDPIKKQELYLEAVHLYTGEFLESQAGMVWAAREARRYRGIFCECVEKAAALLRERGEFEQMENLGLLAANVHPFADWETITMEALVALGKYEESYRLYEETVDLYMQEQGLRPSGRMLELLNRLGAQIEHSYDVLDDIQSNLAEEDMYKPGGYLCSYPVFMGVYQVVSRMMDRNGQSVFLMLCTIVDSKGNPMRDGPMLTELSERLMAAIIASIRRTDVVNRYGKGQYLVLLANTTMENCKVVQKRINEHFIIGRQRTGVHYHVSSVIVAHIKNQENEG